MRLEFLGAAGTVTGSRTLVTRANASVLVDCGLFQGVKHLRERNWATPPTKLSGVDAVVLTHAHIDHSGFLPKLWATGFRGPVFCTEGTADLLRILLPDSGYLQEEHARHANRHRWSKHSPALPLYTQRDAVESLNLLRPVPWGESMTVAEGVDAEFFRAGHIVGSAMVRLAADGKRVTFSGDVGRPNDPIMRPPAELPTTDVLVLESTYGDRRHPATRIEDELADILSSTFAVGGVALLPAFAVGRSQHVLHLVAQLKAQGRIPDIPVFLDSPMAIDATRIFQRHVDEHRISAAECRAMGSVASYSRSPEESKAIDRRGGPMLVISASGMATGGRILHHMKRFLPDPTTTYLVTGFQVAGTRGRSLLDGAEEFKVHGGYVPVRARIRQLDGLSAHADFQELIDWLAQSGAAPRQVLLNHGEPNASDALRRRLCEHFGWRVAVAEEGASVEVG